MLSLSRKERRLKGRKHIPVNRSAAKGKKVASSHMSLEGGRGLTASSPVRRRENWKREGRSTIIYVLEKPFLSEKEWEKRQPHEESHLQL